MALGSEKEAKTAGTRKRLGGTDHKRLTPKEKRFLEFLITHPQRTDVENYEAAFASTTSRYRISALKNSPLGKDYLLKMREKMTEETVITAQDLLAELEEARQAALHGNLDLDAMPEAIRKDKKMMAIAALNKMKHVPQASAAVAATMAKARILGLDKIIVKATVNFSDELASLMDETTNIATGGDDAG